MNDQDLFLIHQYDENTDDEPDRPPMADDGRFDSAGPDPDSGIVALEHYDGDGECRSVEHLSEYDRANL